MKRTLSLILSFVILFSTFPLGITTTFAAEYDGFTYTVSNNSVTITGGDKSLSTITIPSEIEGYPVTTIGTGAFENYYNLQNVVIPESVTTIGYGAFYGCTGLTDVTIPGSVTTIDHMAFQYCTELKNISFSSGLTSIGEQAFMYDEKLETIIIPKSLTAISDAAFYYCPKITTVYYSGSETDFGNIAIDSNNTDLLNADIVYNYQYPSTITAVCGSGEADTEVDVTIELSAESNVCSGSFNVVYDNTKLEVVSVNAGSAISDRNPTINLSYAANTIRTVFVGIYPITNEGTILSIKFKILSDATGSAAITIDRLRVSDFDAKIVPATAVNGQVVILEHSHTWGTWSITKEPTKTAVGEAQRTCSSDSSHIDTKALPVLTDTSVWTAGDYVAPTCEAEGSQEYTSAYGNVTEVIAATGHDWGAWTITKQPTATETGTAERVCENDNSHIDTITLPALTDATVWTKGTYVAPTCEADGSQEYTSIYGTVVETIAATGHAWGDWSITKQPTATETGTAERVCENDTAHVDTKALPVLTDTSVWTAGDYVAPTCEADGLQEYTSAYGNVTEVIPATGHAWGDWAIAKQPTATETGTAERICSNDSNHKDSKEISVLTDETVWTKGEYVAPTCEADGSQEYTSAYGTVVETIAATGHAWGDWSITKQPTATETGTTERVCENDNSHIDTITLPALTDATVWTKGTYVAPTCEADGSQEYVSTYGTVVETIAATGHAWGAWTITKQPTATETGTAERVCENDTAHVDSITLPVLTDTTVWTKGEYVAPTCEADGSQEYTSIYGTVVETIAATGHAWGAWTITKQPTATETGTAERVCENDTAHVDSITLPVLTDTTVWTKGEYVAPTCEAEGSQEYTSAYGTVVETIAATGHAWGDWAITKQPTATETGTAERVCENDTAHVDSITLPVLTDTTVWTKGEYVAPTCEADGSQEYTSAYGNVTEVIAATGHNWEWKIDKEATEDETGLKHEECTKCGEKRNENTVIDKLPKTKFTVTFDVNGGNALTNNTLITESTGKLTELPMATRGGRYSFNGWFTDKKNGTQISIDTVFTEDTTVYAQWSHRGGSSGGGSGSTTYVISFDSMGGSEIGQIRAQRNTTINQPESPVREGYIFGGWFTEKEFVNEYDFASKITKSFTLYAKWAEEWKNPFDDVDDDDWFYDSVKFVHKNGLVKGTEANLFSPNIATTRGMIITILHRMENEPEEGSIIFSDVSDTAYYAKAVAWGTKHGIIKGYDDGLYRPEQNISRQELAAILYRYAKWSDRNADVKGSVDKFADKNNIDDWALESVKWAVGENLMYGTDNRLNPDSYATRAEVSTMLMRYIENIK